MIKAVLNRIKYSFSGIVVLLMFTALFAAESYAQAENRAPVPFGARNRESDDQPKTVKEFLARKRTEKAKKDHEELLSRGDELLRLTGQLEAAYGRDKGFSEAERSKLDSVEKLAERIRKSLGGGGDGEDDLYADGADEPKAPTTVEEAVTDLKEIVVKLVDELKRTTRFSISAAAIQSSNSVLKIVKFLRLRK